MLLAPLHGLEPFWSVVDDAPQARREHVFEGVTVAVAPIVTAPFVTVFDDVPLERPEQLFDDGARVIPPIVTVPFADVYDDVPLSTHPLELGLASVPLQPPHLVVRFFEAVYPDFFDPPGFAADVEIVYPPQPPEPPPPPPGPRGGGGYGPAGGGGGWWDGEVYQFCEDDDDPSKVRVRRKNDPNCNTVAVQELGDSESLASSAAGMFGAGAAGFVGSKAITKAVEKHFGKHAGAAAAVLSVVATAKATDKMAEKSPKLARLGTAVFGSVIAAVDDLVDIYVNDRGQKPVVEIVRTPAVIIQRAQETSSLVVSRRYGRQRSTGRRVVVLRYVSLQEKHTPPTMYVYQEVLPVSAEGGVSIRGTLLELVRRAKRR